MKLKNDFVLRYVADSWIILPLGTAVDFNRMLRLNEAGALLWKALEQGGDRETLADELTKEYTVDRTQALTDVDAFLKKLIQIGCLEE